MKSNHNLPTAEDLLELSRYLEARQKGVQPAPGEAGFPSGFPGELLELAESTEPDPAFIDRLELQIQQMTKTRSKTSRTGWLYALWQSTNLPERKKTMKRLAVYATIGIILFVILWVALPSLLPSPTPTQLVVATPPTNTPIPTPRSALTPTPIPPTSQLPVAINFTPQPIPSQPPILPPLMDTLGAAYGGSGAGNLPQGLPLSLATELPESPAEVSAYYRLENAPLTPEEAREIATQWGLLGNVYLPPWMQSISPDEIQRSYVVVDGLQKLSLWNDELWYELASRLSYGGHQYIQSNLLPTEQAIAIATQFLSERGYLSYPYQVDLSNYDYGMVDFLRVLEDIPVTYHIASVRIDAQGQVDVAMVRREEYQAVGSYPVISAQRAWEMLETNQPSEQVSISYQSAQDGNPQYWGRVYQVGGFAHLFGNPTFLMPLEAGGTPFITLNNLVLVGDTVSLVEYLQGKILYDTPQGYVHVWGEVQQVDGIRQLQLSGWEAYDEFSTYFNGTIRRSAAGDFIELDDGRQLHIPDLPADVPSDMPLYVEGGIVEDSLEWFILQVHPADEGQTPPDLSAANAVIDKVELVYLAPGLSNLPPGMALDPAYRMLIPAWRFTGYIENVAGRDLIYQAYVQAVTNP